MQSDQSTSVLWMARTCTPDQNAHPQIERVGRSEARHRRWVSDPTDVMQALRAERNQKRDLSPAGSENAPKKQASSCMADQNAHLLSVTSEAELEQSKRDALVPMWTVEEDLLILQHVEKYGKRWARIAAQLPGRTDNGVRNRFNRMQRAQELRKSRGPDAGYRCRRCGQPKRGHICAALTRAGHAPAGDELQEQAIALTQLAAVKIGATTSQESAPASPESTCTPSEKSVSSEQSTLEQLSLDAAPNVPVASTLATVADAKALSLDDLQRLSSMSATAESLMEQSPRPQQNAELGEFELNIEDLLEMLQRQELHLSGGFATPNSPSVLAF